MNIEVLFGKFVKRLNQRLMSFPAAQDSVSLPAVEDGSSHLLYLHIPYCISLCPFCSFHRVKFDHSSASRYFDSLRREIALHENLGYRFDELYIGGGTPTVIPEELVRTIGELRNRHSINDVSVETNPDHLRSDSVQRLADAGVSRLSVGVQSLDDGLLKSMQRYDAYGSSDEIVAGLAKSRGVFDTLNVDMIFNLPNQTEISLRRDLDILIDEVGVDQVSFYPLMSTDVTRASMASVMGVSTAENEKTFYKIIVRRFLEAGYVRSSAWCFSRKPGMFDEYIVDREEYVGLGSGAFSYVQGSLFSSTFSLEAYAYMTEAGKSGTVSRRALSERDQMRYYLLMRLFGGELVKLGAETKFSGKFQQTLWPELAALQSTGALRDTGQKLELTERGYYLWVVLMREFFAGINNLREQVRHELYGVATDAGNGEN